MADIQFFIVGESVSFTWNDTTIIPRVGERVTFFHPVIGQYEYKVAQVAYNDKSSVTIFLDY